MSEADVLTGGAAAEEAAGTRPRGQLPERCYACAAPVRGPYCWACGQKNDDCRRSVWSLAAESVRDVASLEGRFLRTVRAVVTRPGRYLRDYGRGVRSPYSPPVRFFLVISFAFFTTLWLTDRQIVAFQPEVHVDEDGQVQIDEWAGGFFVRARDVAYSPEERAAMLEAVRDDTASGEVVAEVLREEARDEAAALREEASAERDAILERGGPGVASDLAALEADLRAEIAQVDAELAEDLSALEDAGSAADDALADAAAGLREGFGPDAPGAAALDEARERLDGTDEGFVVGLQPDDADGIVINGREVSRERLTAGLFRLAENPRLFNGALAEWIPRLMVLMIPLMALSGALFVRGRDALLYDHALLALNTHALAFGLMTLGMWTAGFLPGWLFGWAVFAGLPFYYYRAMRGAFGRRRRKVVAATVFVFSVYGLVFSAALTAAAISAFAGTL